MRRRLRHRQEEQAVKPRVGRRLGRIEKMNDAELRSVFQFVDVTYRTERLTRIVIDHNVRVALRIHMKEEKR